MTDEETEELRKQIHVCDHAVLRYVQRVLGMNTEHVREELKHSETKLIKYLHAVGLISIPNIKNDILDESLLRLIHAFGPNGYYRTKRYLAVVKQNKVVTIIK